MSSNKSVYLDHSATTPVAKEVVEAMQPFFSEIYGNPSSVHRWGQQARAAIENARSTIARLINAQESEIIFLSGGTEADNLAVRGIAYANRNRGNHIITSKAEHKAVLETCKSLEKEGFRVTYLNVDSHAMVNPEDVRKAITPKTILISVIHGNNEVGTINPIAEIGEIARDHRIYFHSDAVQSFGKLPLNVQAFPVDLLSFSAHKIYGPKGVGALFIRRGTQLKRLLDGGGHEMGRRAGTENVPGIVGFARAAELAYARLEEDSTRIARLRDYFREQLQQRLGGVRLNGHPTQRLYHNLHVSFSGCDGEALLLSLDMNGIAASTGSACTSGSVEPSHVLKAMNLPLENRRAAIRFTLGRETTRQEIDYVLDRLEEIVKRLRKIT